MAKQGFDNGQYLKLQSQHIQERIAQFGGKLYLEFGGKLFDDFHASRVLPGFEPDSKIRMLAQMKDKAEIIIAINASDIEKNKVRGDLGITYDSDVLRLIDAFRSMDLYVGSVVVTQYAGQTAADAFQKRLESLGVKVYRHYPIAGYPHNIAKIVSDEGFGRNDYVETSRPLVVVTAPGPGSGKMATCLSQLYHEYKLDPFHLQAYGETTVNYNRDVEVFPVLAAMFEKIIGSCPYKSPTDMGVNMAGKCIYDDQAVQEAARQEIVRRYYDARCELRQGKGSEQTDAAGGDHPVHPEGGRRRQPGGRADRRARHGHRAARRLHGHRQDLRAHGLLRRRPSERPEGPVRPGGTRRPPHRPERHRAHPDRQSQVPGLQQPPAPQRRGADRPGRLGQPGPQGPGRPPLPGRPQRVPGPLLRHPLAPRREHL